VAHAHLFEFEDLSWYPRVLREGTTLYLEAVERIFGVHRLFAPKLRRAFERTGTRRLVDMGSGGGGPVRHAVAMVEQELACRVDVTLTDLHPNERAAKAIENLGSDTLRYLRESVDASNPPPGLPGVRSMFAFFHHLRPEPAREVLASAYRNGEAICIFEITDPTPIGILSCIMMPIYVLLLTPFVRPIGLWQLLLTYVVPVLPFLIAWDGFVSTLRTYTSTELEQMTRDLRDDTYEWDIGTVSHPVLPIRFPYALGLPRVE
jgi:hypothetical protein